MMLDYPEKLLRRLDQLLDPVALFMALHLAATIAGEGFGAVVHELVDLLRRCQRADVGRVAALRPPLLLWTRFRRLRPLRPMRILRWRCAAVARICFGSEDYTPLLLDGHLMRLDGLVGFRQLGLEQGNLLGRLGIESLAGFGFGFGIVSNDRPAKTPPFSELPFLTRRNHW
jgi:hypothetical protein